MTPFVYRDFYGVPLLLMFEHNGATYVLHNDFDSNSPEHQEDYAVYRLEQHTTLSVENLVAWKANEKQFLRYYNVKSVHFDIDKTRLIDAEFLTITTPFKYRGFWDVPLFIQFEHGTKSYFLNCQFSDELDEYWDYYEIYESENIDNALLDEERFSALEKRLLGQIPVKIVRFDATNRNYLDDSFIQMIC